MDNQGFWKEVWKPVELDFEFTNQCRFEVSNWGRVKSYTKVANGRLLKGSITEGYRVIRLKLYRARDAASEEKFTALKNEISALYKKRQLQVKKKLFSETIDRTTQLIEKKKKDLSKKLAANLKKRTINHHFMVHRLVAAYFLEKPTQKETIVGHLDYDKLNNRAANLKWMTPEENQVHQSKSPNVIEEKKLRKTKINKRNIGLKLTSTQVMHIKLQLKRARPVKQIAKQFKVSEMQIWRIKSGENWAHVSIPD